MRAFDDTLSWWQPARRALVAPACALWLALALAACGAGGSAGVARRLLAQTFSAPQAPSSGRIELSLTLAPVAAARPGPAVSLDLAGVFQSRGPGRVAAWRATLAPRIGARAASLALVCTGSAAYVELAGDSYRLPAAAFARLAESFRRVAGHGGDVLRRMGLSPLGWIVDPHVVATAAPPGGGREGAPGGGGRLIEVRAGVRVGALMRSVDALAARASAAGAGLPGAAAAITPALRRRAASAARAPAGLWLWTTASGHALRALRIAATLPVGGALSGLLGGARSARAALSLRYTQIDRPQRISAPGNPRPFRQLAGRLAALVLRLGAGGWRYSSSS